MTADQIKRLWHTIMGQPLPPRAPLPMALTYMSKEMPNRLSFEVGRLKDPLKYLDLTPEPASSAAG